MHYSYYYYEQLLANQKNAIRRHLLTIECETLLIAMISAICKYTYMHTFEGSYEIKQEMFQRLI